MHADEQLDEEKCGGAVTRISKEQHEVELKMSCSGGEIETPF